MKATIYSSGNYVIVETEKRILEFAKGHTIYNLVNNIFFIKEITQGQLRISVKDIENGNIYDPVSQREYDVKSFTTFLRENTGL